MLKFPFYILIDILSFIVLNQVNKSNSRTLESRNSGHLPFNSIFFPSGILASPGFYISRLIITVLMIAIIILYLHAAGKNLLKSWVEDFSLRRCFMCVFARCLWYSDVHPSIPSGIKSLLPLRLAVPSADSAQLSVPL